MKITELHESFCQYQETIRNYRSTVKSYRETLRTFLQACPEVERVDEVSFLIAQKFFYWGRSTKKWTPGTFITHHKRLNVFFKWAKERNFIAENPFEQIEKPRQEKALPKRLTKQEALTLIETAACLPYPHAFLRYRNHAMFAMFLYCGLRKTELLTLKVTDVDLTNMVICIRHDKRIIKASGTYFYIHMLRHTFATLMIEGQSTRCFGSFGCHA